MERRLPQLFFALSLIALALMLAAAWQANAPSWKLIRRTFCSLRRRANPTR
jgi:hypothetical protein